MEIRTRYVDKLGQNITGVSINDRLERGKTATWNGNIYKITSIAYLRNETFVQLDCEKKIPVLPFPQDLKPTVRRKKKIKQVPAVQVPEVQSVAEEAPSEVAAKPTKKKAAKKESKPKKKATKKVVKKVA